MRTGFTAKGGWWVVAQVVLFWLVAVVFVRGPLTLTGPILAATGLLVVVAGAALAGDGVWRLRDTITPYPAPRHGAPLVDRGAYGLVRHPIYGGLVLVVVGLAIAVGSWTATMAGLGLGAFFLVKSTWEERLLVEAIPEYDAYRLRVRHRLVPFLV